MSISEQENLQIKSLVDEFVRAGKGVAELVRVLRERGICTKYHAAFDIANRELRNAYINARSEGLSPSLDETTLEFCKNGKSVAEFANALVDRGFFDKLDEARKIAQYEMLSSSSIKQNDSIMQSSSIDRKEWRYTGCCGNNAEICRNHSSMDSQIVPKDKPFVLIGSDGKTYYPMYPRDPILPPEERIECTCLCQGIVRDDVLGLTLEERRELQARIIAKDDGKWEKELNARNRARAGIK